MAEPTDTPARAAPLVTLIAAAALSALYLAAAGYMFDKFAIHKPPDGSSYDHALGIFAGIQSIGLTAVGVLLGVAVQQPRVTDAKAEEQKAKNAIRAVIHPSNELGGGRGLPERVIERLMEGL
jgi:hypothetical protein